MTQVDVVLLQFGLGSLALMMRYLSRPLLKCCQTCCGCLYGCLCCLCERRAAPPGEPRACSIAVRWYWFHLAVQLAFLVREGQVISTLGWPWEVQMSFTSLCATYVVVFLEVRNFSRVRNKDVVTKITIDGLLDMLLLPVNIGFFGHLCVRKLRLQEHEHSLEVISTIVESSEIWEAWALWSVLGLFVTVVDVESREDVQRRAFVTPFKNLSIQGVRTWVFMIMAITATRLFMTFLQTAAPSLCFWASRSCTSCIELYEVNFQLAASAVNFILCSFALAFVFTFEHTFNEYLHRIGPFWKFWGVKGVVSVTYFQWLVLSYGPFNLEDKRIYLLHSLLSTVEMPILALIHSSCAYPYGQPWLDYLLQLQEKDMLEAGGRRSQFGESSVLPPQKVGFWPCLIDLMLWTLGCCAAHGFVVHILPLDEAPRPEMFNKTCTQEGDIWHYIADNAELHYRLRNDTIEKHRLPNIGGAWLHLCSQTELDCAPGFQGSPSLQCSPAGTYKHNGLCLPIRCGQPKEEFGHARLRSMMRQWTSDTEIDYECVRGYIGRVKGVCGKDGRWRFSGGCTEVICPSPPVVPRAKPLLEPHELENRTWQAGTSLRYQCEAPYTGILTATCEDDGSFVLTGRCMALCPTPPMLPNASAVYSNRLAKRGFYDGVRVAYECAPGFGGTLVATCRETGKYSIEGSCKLRCTDLEGFLRQHYGSRWAQEMRVNYSEGLDFTGTGEADLVPLTCGLGLVGQPFAACHLGLWQLLGAPCRTFRTASGCRCRRSWKYCEGFLQNKCVLWHGCRGSEDSSWCEVIRGSCGRSSWDYCVGQGRQDEPEVSLEPEPKAVLFRFSICIAAVLFGLVALVWMSKIYRGSPGPEERQQIELQQT